MFAKYLKFCEGENENGASFRFHSIHNQIEEPFPRSSLGRIKELS
jgi:hypothetical protein